MKVNFYPDLTGYTVVSPGTASREYGIGTINTVDGTYVTGDRLVLPDLMRLYVVLETSGPAALLEALANLIEYARAATRVEYRDAGGYILSTRNVAGLSEWEVVDWPNVNGLAKVALALVPTSPYWNNGVNDEVREW